MSTTQVLSSEFLHQRVYSLKCYKKENNVKVDIWGSRLHEKDPRRNLLFPNILHSSPSSGKLFEKRFWEKSEAVFWKNVQQRFLSISIHVFQLRMSSKVSNQNVVSHINILTRKIFFIFWDCCELKNVSCTFYPHENQM